MGLMISAIKNGEQLESARLGQPSSDADLENVMAKKESGNFQEEDLKYLQSPFFEGLDDL